MAVEISNNSQHIIFGFLGGMLITGGLKISSSLLLILGLILSLGSSPLLSLLDNFDRFDKSSFFRQWVIALIVGGIIGLIID